MSLSGVQEKELNLKTHVQWHALSSDHCSHFTPSLMIGKEHIHHKELSISRAHSGVGNGMIVFLVPPILTRLPVDGKYVVEHNSFVPNPPYCQLYNCPKKTHVQVKLF